MIITPPTLPGDSERLREAGFSDRQIVDIALAGGARNLFSRVRQALAIRVEDVPGLPSQLAASLSGVRTPSAG